MISTSLHHFSPDLAHLPSETSTGHDHHFSSQQMATVGLEALAHSPQYALHFDQQRQFFTGSKNPPRQRYHPYSSGHLAAATRSQRDAMTQDRVARGSNTSAPVRRRISRACDQCNQLRTKCDGKVPCAHCVEFGLSCEYVRERKKRGKASRKDLAMQQAAAAAATGTSPPAASNNDDSDKTSPRPRERSSSGEQDADDTATSGSVSATDSKPPEVSFVSAPPTRRHTMSTVQDASYNSIVGVDRAMGVPDLRGIDDQMHSHPMSNIDPRLSQEMSMAMPEYSNLPDFHRNMLSQHPAHSSHQGLPTGAGMLPHAALHADGLQGFPENPYLISPTAQAPHHGAFQLSTGDSPMSAGFLGNGSVNDSPGWFSLGSPGTAGLYGLPPPIHTQHLRYPVLRPLLPHLGNLLPVSIACDLLELYFQSSSCAFIRPLSPYVLGYVLRKRSLLHETDPRACSPALLASMLWIGAQTSESSVLTTPPSARGKICQKLLELTVGLLRPLIHSPVAVNEASPNYAANTVINGVALGGFGVALPGPSPELDTSPGATGGLDDVITYMHLAIVVSASEYKAASLRWWNAAWSLARELKLGRELPLNPAPSHGANGQNGEGDNHGHTNLDMNTMQRSIPGSVSEEEREERRRIWWLLYTIDRHLALCYNRPLFLLDVECDSLFQPVDDAIWQAGDYYDPAKVAALNDPSSIYFRRRGPTFQCNGHSIFGYFLPLMTILGEIVDLNHARNHPRFGLRFRSGSEWDEQAAEITQQLEAYERSLQEFEQRFTNSMRSEEEDVHSPSAHSVHSSSSRVTDQLLQTKIVVAYGTHVMHTLHILLNGKWDPISMLDDNDLWISSQAFVIATGHAVDAAKAIRTILDCDPDLSFMPFFFGIYLLQGSFLLLLIADKLQEGATPNIVEACETIVRAHEVCVTTLNTEYQRNFRKVMRSALMQVRGLGDSGEQQLRRREVLALYRWTGDGSGLAL